ncbi:fimbrial protein [Burkholderia sp. BCC1644]|uniref:fimbrial protein n=1 Tax=Burkholderia sp. BCC1644 TaxID=2676293 RepID=UPI001590071D|nr:fimbrial protein [Burkholderia sp. BCC1644]
MNSKKSATSLAFGLFWMMMSGTAAALDRCTIFPSSNPSSNTTVPYEVTLSSLSTSSFDPGVPNGTVLASQTVQFGTTNMVVRCNTVYQTTTWGQPGVASEPVYHTMPTNVSGVGVRMKYTAGAWRDEWWPYTYTSSAGGTETTWGLSTSPVLFEFVKIGRITAGGKITGEIARQWVTSATTGDQFPYLLYKISGAIEIKPAVPTCSVTTKTINVPFGGVSMTSVENAPERSFNIGLSCSGGTNAAKTRMYMTLTDATDSSNRSNMLNLTSNSTAKGVGVQIKNGSTAVSYGPDSSNAGNENQWFVTETGNGNVDIPLTARYVTTGGKLAAGSANAIATFTMSYQ